MDHTQSFVLIALAIALAAAILLLFKAPRKTHSKNPPDATRLMPYLYVDQLNPTTMRMHKRYTLNRDQLLNLGAVITREGNPGDVELECAFTETETVGSNHAVVAMDEFGCFIQNQHSNGMTLERYGDQVDEVSVKHGTVVYLGEQPIRFSLPGRETRKRTGLDILRWIWNALNRLLSHAGRNRERKSNNAQDQVW